MINKIVKEIKQAKSLLVVAHRDPDGDTIGSALALAIALKENSKKEVYLFCQDPLPYNLQFLPQRELINHQLPQNKTFELLVVLDCGELERVSAQLVKAENLYQKIINIDHHQTNKGCGLINWLEPKTSSVGEMIAFLLSELGYRLNKDIASCLYTAIITDTGSFRYSNTTPSALRTSAKLLEAGVDPWFVSSNYYESQPLRRIEMLRDCLQTLEYWPQSKVALLTLTSEIINKYGNEQGLHDGIINYPRSIEGAEAALLIRELGQREFKVSFRSKGNYDVAKIAELYGGGGHHNAAGCLIKAPLAELKSMLKKNFSSLI